MSHFTSRHYWEVGATDASLTTGWMGRYLDIAGDAANPFQGLSLDGQMNPTLATAKNPVAAIDQPNNFGVWVNGVWGNASDWTLESASSLGDKQRNWHDPAIQQVARAASEVGIVRRGLKPWTNAAQNSSGSNTSENPAAVYGGSVTYPLSSDDDLPARLAGLASMIAAGVPLKCVALTTDVQFDTHSSQPQTFDTGVQLVSDSLAAFQADLEARGIDQRVLVHVWSEFGRRAEENSSDGTDHGAAGTSLLIGSRVNGGMIGEFPALSALDVNGNQRVNVDFRGVYASLLEQWFDHDAGAIIPARRSSSATSCSHETVARLPAVCRACRACGRPAGRRSAEAHSRTPPDQRAGVVAVAIAQQRAGRNGAGRAVEPRSGHARHLDPPAERGRPDGRAGARQGSRTLPGKISQATWHLRAGRYELFCSMPGHMALGMHANLRVTRSSRR